jgi:hypothetical protein
MGRRKKTESKGKKGDEVETHLGHPVKKTPPAYAEGTERGPTAKTRRKKRKSD